MNTFMIAGPNTLTSSVANEIGGSTTSATGNPVSLQTQCSTDTFSVTGPTASVPPVICGTNSGSHSDCFEAFILFCNIILPLARIRWVWLTLSSLCPLLQTVSPNNLGNIKRKIIGNIENRTWGCWVKSKYVSALCSPPCFEALAQPRDLFLIDDQVHLSHVKQMFNANNPSLTWLLWVNGTNMLCVAFNWDFIGENFCRYPDSNPQPSI